MIHGKFYNFEKLSSRAKNAWMVLINKGKEPTIYNMVALYNCGQKTVVELIEWRLDYFGFKWKRK